MARRINRVGKKLISAVIEDDVKTAMAAKTKPNSLHGVTGGAVYTFPGQSVGIKAASTADVIKAVQKGLPYRALTKLESESGFSAERIAQLVQMPLRTLARRKKTGRLAPPESERLLRFGMVFEKALALFDGNRVAAHRWLSSPVKALGDESPLTMTQTEIGAREVEDLIGRLEHGVFS